MLDEIDQQIVALLQAGRTGQPRRDRTGGGLTASSVYERVRKLEERGVILGYRALVDPAALGQTITAFIRVRQMADVRPFERAVRAETNVLNATTSPAMIATW
ncbi:MAG: Lrp/AsnC family transcriptional regulator [Anaerolineae bacterium]|nr:Lrp/AsnC family transcriptional regulator [Anaerolineae bacterium]